MVYLAELICFRHYGSLNRTLPINTTTVFPKESYMQAGNFCIKHCRDFLMFTWAELEVVLASMGLWNIRTLPGRNVKQYLLYQLFTSYIHLNYSALYISNFSKSSEFSFTLSTLATCTQVTSMVKQTVFV